jgi:hypothetical protein
MNMPIFLAVFFIGCMTITAFIALIIWVAFFEPKNDDYEKTHWIPQEPSKNKLDECIKVKHYDTRKIN